MKSHISQYQKLYGLARLSILFLFKLKVNTLGFHQKNNNKSLDYWKEIKCIYEDSLIKSHISQYQKYGLTRYIKHFVFI